MIMEIHLKTFLRTLSILGMAVFLAACSGSATPTLPPIQNIEPTLNSVRTEAAATIAAALTAQPTATMLPPTATLAPSATTVLTDTVAPVATLAPTDTPAPPTNTPGVVPTVGPTAVVTSKVVEAGCKITASSTSGADVKAPGSDFDARWTIQNTGSSTWSKGTVDYRYSSGTKMQKSQDVYDFNSDVAGSASITLIVDMIAPTKAGVYQANWVVTQGGTVLCSLPVVVTVQ
jgi:hypothetical protein